MSTAAQPQLEPGRAYRTRDLRRWSANPTRLARRLVDEGKLREASHGLYYAPIPTRFGPAPPPSEELLRAFLGGEPFLVTGPPYWNALGLGSTAMFAVTLVYNTRRSGEFQLGGRRFLLRRVYFPETPTAEWFVILGMWAQHHVQSSYKRWSQVRSRGGITGVEAAAAVMRKAGIRDVEIVEIRGHLTDHYDPVHKRLALSSENYRGTSLAALGVARAEASGRNRFDWLVQLASADEVRALRPDMNALAEFDMRGVIVTAPADDGEHDFVSRWFGPRAGVDEDPVTGSAHCCLAPWWAARLGRSAMRGFQASARGGSVGVRLHGARVELLGRAVTVLRGELLVD